MSAREILASPEWRALRAAAAAMQEAAELHGDYDAAARHEAAVEALLPAIRAAAAEHGLLVVEDHPGDFHLRDNAQEQAEAVKRRAATLAHNADCAARHAAHLAWVRRLPTDGTTADGVAIHVHRYTDVDEPGPYNAHGLDPIECRAEDRYRADTGERV